MEFENVRDALKQLIELNDKELNPDPQTKMESEKVLRSATVNDIQDINLEALMDIADKLGMNDLYLDYKVPNKE